jgi:beta-N-acetylhexosaminidase
MLIGCFRDTNKSAPDQDFFFTHERTPPLNRSGEGTALAVKEYRAWAETIAAAMDDRLLTAQVIMTGIDGKDTLNKVMKTLLSNSPPGAIMLFKYNLDTENEAVRLFLEECVSFIGAAIFNASGIPELVPFVAVDHEGGLVHRFGPGVAPLPAPAWFWDSAQNQGRESALTAVEETAQRSGREIRNLGITMNLAPVAELLDEENRFFLETRSYGPDPDFTEAAVSAFIRGMEAAGIACVVKHFPGNTGEDPHSGRAVLAADREALDKMVKPFAGVIREGHVPAVMVSHIVVSAWDEERNASLSPKIIRDWLRGNLGFTGIVVADDFSMSAVAASGLDSGTAAVEALNAGVDMVMTWPRNLASVHRAILTALQEGRLSREQLRESVARIIFEKIRYGLISRGL